MPLFAFTIYLAHEVTVHHAKQQQSKLHHPLFYRRNDKAALLLHGKGDLGTREGIYLIRGILLNVISFSPRSAGNLLLLEDCPCKCTLTLQEIGDEQWV
jgi:hypothetical protein